MRHDQEILFTPCGNHTPDRRMCKRKLSFIQSGFLTKGCAIPHGIYKYSGEKNSFAKNIIPFIRILPLMIDESIHIQSCFPDSYGGSALTSEVDHIAWININSREVPFFTIDTA